MSCICLCAPDQIRTGMDYSVREIGLETGFEPVKVPIFSKQDFLRQFTLLVKSLVSTVPPLGQYFQWTNLCCLGGIRTLRPSPNLHSRCSTNWTTRLPFVWRLLQALLTQPLWTTMDCHCGFQNSRHKSLYSIKSLQDLLHPEYVLDNDDSFRVVSCLYKLFGSWLQIGHIQIRTGTTTPLTNLFL